MSHSAEQKPRSGQSDFSINHPGHIRKCFCGWRPEGYDKKEPFLGGFEGALRDDDTLNSKESALFDSFGRESHEALQYFVDEKIVSLAAQGNADCGAVL